MDDNRINYLSSKLLQGEITPAERQELDDWYNNFDTLEYQMHSDLSKQAFADQLYQQISSKTGLKTVKHFYYYRYAAIAASLLLCLSTAIYIVYTNTRKTVSIAQHISDIKPGGNRATLTLANGKIIDLKNAPNGLLATGGTQSVHKTSEGVIAYNDSEKTTGNNDYNTLSTPRGGQFSVKLPDGTLAVLDAQSSIRYPSSFNAGNRIVEVSGQVYFEVVHRAKQPFIVKTAAQTIEDLGTHFNINAYPDAATVKTTLEEGRVSITTPAKTVFLKPGQAALSHADSQEINVTTADLEETLAWKNGYFRFNDEHIENIMSQIGRWYNIEVVYSGQLPADGFNGTILRSKNLSQVLNMLERTGIIHFKIEGRRITVLP